MAALFVEGIKEQRDRCSARTIEDITKTLFQWEIQGNKVCSEMILTMENVHRIVQQINEDKILFISSVINYSRFYYGELCSLLLATEHGPIYIIDTVILPLSDVLQTLQDLLENKAITKVLHSGLSTLTLFRRCVETLHVDPFVDSSVAVQYTTNKNIDSLSKMIFHYCNVQVSSLQWNSAGTSLLTQVQLEILSSRMHFWRISYQKMSFFWNEAANRQRYAWIREDSLGIWRETTRLPYIAPYKRFIKKSKRRCTDSQINQLRKLIKWREYFCEKHDFSRGFLPNRVILDATIHPEMLSNEFKQALPELLDEYENAAKKFVEEPRIAPHFLDLYGKLDLIATEHNMRAQVIIPMEQLEKIVAEKSPVDRTNLRIPEAREIIENWRYQYQKKHIGRERRKLPVDRDKAEEYITWLKRRQYKVPYRTPNDYSCIHYSWKENESQAEIIVDVGRLKEVVQELEQHKTVFIDTEFIGKQYYYDKLCLFQITGEHGTIYLIDAIIIQAQQIFAILFPILSNCDIIKVFYASQSDLRIIRYHLNELEFVPLFDMEIAMKFSFSEDIRNGFSLCVQRLLGITISKESQMSDWEGILTETQIQYAANDVYYLRLCYAEIIKLWKDFEVDKFKWTLEESYELWKATEFTHKAGKISKINCLSLCAEEKAYGILLGAWREYFCRKYNFARYLIPDSELIRAVCPEETPSELELCLTAFLKDFSEAQLPPPVLKPKVRLDAGMYQKFCEIVQPVSKKYSVQPCGWFSHHQLASIKKPVCRSFFRVPELYDAYLLWIEQVETSKQ